MDEKKKMLLKTYILEVTLLEVYNELRIGLVALMD